MPGEAEANRDTPQYGNPLLVRGLERGIFTVLNMGERLEGRRVGRAARPVIKSSLSILKGRVKQIVKYLIRVEI